MVTEPDKYVPNKNSIQYKSLKADFSAVSIEIIKQAEQEMP